MSPKYALCIFGLPLPSKINQASFFENGSQSWEIADILTLILFVVAKPPPFQTRLKPIYPRSYPDILNWKF